MNVELWRKAEKLFKKKKLMNQAAFGKAMEQYWKN